MKTCANLKLISADMIFMLKLFADCCSILYVVACGLVLTAIQFYMLLHFDYNIHK